MRGAPAHSCSAFSYVTASCRRRCSSEYLSSLWAPFALLRLNVVVDPFAMARGCGVLPPCHHIDLAIDRDAHAPHEGRPVALTTAPRLPSEVALLARRVLVAKGRSLEGRNTS